MQKTYKWRRCVKKANGMNWKRKNCHNKYGNNFEEEVICPKNNKDKNKEDKKEEMKNEIKEDKKEEKEKKQKKKLVMLL